MKEKKEKKNQRKKSIPAFMRKFRDSKHMEHWKVIAFYLCLYDVIAVNFSYFFCLLLRFDLNYTDIPQNYLSAFLRFAPFYTVFWIIVFHKLHLYNSLWRFASFSELNHIFEASVITAVFQSIGITLFFERMPISYYLVGALLQFVLLVAVRFLYRYITLERVKKKQSTVRNRNAMVIGAGAAGQVILKELKSSEEVDAKACCVIDDNSNKWGRFMGGVPIVGGRDQILESVKKYDIDLIFFAIPTASSEEKKDILNICKESGCEMQSLPGVYQLANGEVLMSKMRPVAVEDLLGRKPIHVNMSEIYQYIEGKTILVTGGGGSIGSELCRQIAGHHPKQLVIFDVYENNAYDIEQELREKYPDLNLSVLIGSVRDSRRINGVFENYKPDIVYHAAAHKHVPLMEVSPNEAIKNNVIGTYKTAYAALKNGTKRFVLISTDKAVNPTNIMGASKRLCEMVIQSMDAISKSGKTEILPSIYGHKETHEHPGLGNITNIPKTRFVAVRFGNVLGSNGSVIPLFKRQIEKGGPVTVTHPDVIRYFMTIPEAVSLVLQAGTYAKGGEIFVLDMGAPVKIDTLARNLIKLSGFKPDEDIKVTYTGLRPGEKLFEEKLMAEEGLHKTENELIHIGEPIPFDVEVFLEQLKELAKAGYENSDDIVQLVEGIVTTFHPVGNKPTGEENRDSWELEKEKLAMAEVAATTMTAVNSKSK